MAVVFFLILGIIYRLLLIHFFPQPFVYDQLSYAGFARGIVEHGLNVETYRLYGYPFFIALVYKLFGMQDMWGWKIAQVILDTVTGLLLLQLAKKILPTVKGAWMGFILYLFNPYTSAYTGVMLSEVMTIFWVMLSFLLFYYFLQYKRVLHTILTAFAFGFLPQIRPGFFFFSLFAFFVMICSVCKYRKKLKSAFGKMLLCLFFFLLPFVYTVVGNFITFHQLSPLSVDNAFVKEFYISLYLERLLPFDSYPLQVWQIHEEFHLPQTPSGRKEMAVKYMGLARAEISKDPGKFIRWRINKLWYVWDKHYLFPYVVESTDKFVNALIYLTNIVILLVSVYGLVYWMKKKDIQKRESIRWLSFLIISFFVYISLSHAFSQAVERYSLPAYPLVFLFAGVGIWYILSRIRKQEV